MRTAAVQLCRRHVQLGTPLTAGSCEAVRQQVGQSTPVKLNPWKHRQEVTMQQGQG